MVTSFRTLQKAAATSGTTEDLTVSGFGTPDGYMFVSSRGTANGTEAPHAIFTLGAGDKTAELVAAVRDEDNQSTTDSDRRGATDESILWMDLGSSIDGEMNYNTTATDGVQMSYGNNPAFAYLINGFLIRAVEVSCGNATHTAGSNNSQNFSVGHTVDVLICLGHTTSFNDAQSSNYSISYGAAVRGSGTAVQGQFAISLAQNTSLPQGGTSSAKLWNNRCFGAMNSATTQENESRSLECTSFPTNAFQLTRRTGSGDFNLTFGYIAIELDTDVSAWAGVVTTPTTTGSEGKTDPGFKPQFLLMIPSAITTVNTDVKTNVTGTGVLPLTFADATNQYTIWNRLEDTADPTDTASMVHNRLIYTPDSQGTILNDASLTSFDTNGWTWNFATANATARQCGVLAIEEEAGVAATSLPGRRSPLRALIGR